MKATGGSRKLNTKSVPNPNGREGNPVSLQPLSPDEAMRRLLTVPPEAKEKHPILSEQQVKERA